MSAAEITTITLNIDGRTVEAQPGETILDCALRNGIEIPHLCAETGLTPHGGCRMCLVEVDGMRGYPPSCATPVTPGMNVRTDTPQLRRLRRNVLALMMLEHPNACLLCGHRQECEAFRPAPEKVGSTTGCHTCNNKPECYVRNLAEQLELTELPIAPEYHHRPVERAQPFLDRDLNLCILCGRCVRVCREQHGKAVIDFIGRGSQARIGQAFDMSLLEAGCTFCGSCVDACPTGTLSDRYAKWWGAPDRRVATTCAFCPEACAMTVAAQEGRVISTRALAVGHPLCVVGRFAVAEFHNGKNRLTRPLMRVKSMQRPTDWKPAMEAAAARLAHFTGEAFALVCDDSLTLEDRLALKRFTRAIMDAPESHYIELRRDSRGRTPLAELPESVRAVWVTGPFIDPAAADGLDVLIVSDAYPSALSEKADFVFPATLFAETEGTILDRAGALRPLRPAAAPPGDALADWQIAVRLSRALGSEGLAWESSAELTREVQGESAGLWLQRDRPPEAALDLSKRVAWFRGHRIEEQVSGLLELPPLEDCPLPADASEKRAVAKAFQTAAAGANPDDGRFRIVSLRELVPNTYEVVLSAPEVAKVARAGQFVIVMADAWSERVPYTLCDWDAEAGTITLVVQEKGQSSRKLVMMEAGECVAHVTGPLGIPLAVERYGQVVVTGGCYGVGAVRPLIRALREAGNRVTAIVEARSHYLTYYRDQLAAAADVFIQTTIDGSMGERGHAVDALARRLSAGEAVDRVICVGCPFMMKLTAEATRPYGIPTWAALNPIMVDGTGMCGACRITVGDKVRFACVDGPFFDAHLVDWDEVKDRRSAYAAAEIMSIGRTASPGRHHTGATADAEHHHGACGCYA